MAEDATKPPASTPTPRPTVQPTARPTARPTDDPHQVVITEADLVSALGGGAKSPTGDGAEGLDVKFADGTLRVKADRVTYGQFKVNNLALAGGLVAQGGKLQFVAESVSPGGIVGAMIPMMVNQALAQYTSSWYIQDAKIRDGSLELRIR